MLNNITATVRFLMSILCFSVALTGMGCKRSSDSEIKTWTWKEEGDLREARELPRLAMWKGALLVVGGGSEMRATALRTTELFDQNTHHWQPGPELNHPRRDAELVSLQDGRLLIIGGSEGPTRTGSPYVEALDPNTNKWVELPNMTDSRIGHTAVLLQDGRVLVVGGQSRPDTYLASAEIFDPSKNTWQRLPDMKEARSVHHARLLKDGSVIVIGGGTDSTATDGVEIFDPRTNTWRVAASMKEPRWGFSSAVLDDGRVIVAGGRIPARKAATLPEDKIVILKGVEIYDPQKNAWVDGPPMNIPRTMGLPNVELVRLNNGGLMFVGGRSYPAPYHGVTLAEYFDPRTNNWTPVSSLSIGRSYQASFHMPSGEIMVVGGRGPEFLPLQKSECFRPNTQK